MIPTTLLSLIVLVPQAAQLDGVTFAASPRTLYVPVRDVGQSFGWKVHFDGSSVYLNGRKLNSADKKLVDGTRLMPVRSLQHLGGQVEWIEKDNRALVAFGRAQVFVRHGAKRAVVNKSEQLLVCWQGAKVVMRSPISSGRKGYESPKGTWRAGPYKARMHRSSLYNNAPMPWSVQVQGDIFIHGYEEVPTVPASHGCIRVPMGKPNKAQWFYEWVEVGTPITITGEWPRRVAPRS